MTTQITKTEAEFTTALESFVHMAEGRINAGQTELNTSTLTVERGKRYCKVVRTFGKKAGDHRSVFCFIDQDGTVLKAESWKKPARGPRGNIFNEDNGIGAVTQHGIVYFK